MAEATLLGRPGEMGEGENAPDAYSTFMGGLPVLLPGIELGPVSCSKCAKPMQLFLQAFAPLTAQQGARKLANRQLLLFSCLEPGCGGGAGSWRALRLQAVSRSAGAGVATPSASHAPVPVRPPPTSSGIDWAATMAGGDGKASASGDGASQPATTAGRSFPGAGGEPAPAGDDEDDDPFNFDDLDASLDAIHRASDTRPAVDMSTAAEPPLVRDSNKLAPTDAGSSTAAAAGDEEGASLAAAPAPGQAAPPPPGGLLAGAAHLPCFYLYAETDGGSASGRPAGKSAQQAAAAAGPVLARAPGEAWDGSEESRDDAAAWAGEAWEEDAVLRPGAVDAVFLKFSKTLTRCPDQCARYRFRGVLEWPEPTLPTAPPCPACGAERCLEVQLMSPALVAMAEARAWSALLPPALAELPGSWDWITVAVFTCSAACAGKAGPGVFEEHVATAVDA